MKNEEIEEMLKEASGSINFIVFLIMFGEKLKGGFVRVRVYIRVYIRVCAFVCARSCVYSCVRAFVCAFVCIFVCARVYVFFFDCE